MQGGRGGPLPFVHQPLHPLAAAEVVGVVWGGVGWGGRIRIIGEELERESRFSGKRG